MFCKKCGTEIKNGTFCPSCGTNNAPAGGVPPMPNANLVNGAPKPSGMPFVNPISGNNGGGAVQKNQKNLFLAIGAGVVALVIIIVLLASLGGRGSNSPKGAIKAYYKAFEKQSASAMLDCVPADLQKDILEEYDISKKDLKQALDDMYSDMNDSYDEDIDKVELDIKKVKDQSKGDTEDFADDVNDAIKSYNRKLMDRFDEKKIKKTAAIKIKVRFEDKDGDKLDTLSNDESIVYKYKGKWYSESAILNVLEAAEDAE
ncbi:hypothetical protein [uncultured Ruminococcus sp.]|uniref:hypothetical protein n=2 Tax=Ruminococcus TaxID=1263 RepID=UPI0026DB50DC|nr:hypothetical protein [uncultured Ruminococcus sp.]